MSVHTAEQILVHHKDRELFARIDTVLAEYERTMTVCGESATLDVPPHLSLYALEVERWRREALIARRSRSCAPRTS